MKNPFFVSVAVGFTNAFNCLDWSDVMDNLVDARVENSIMVAAQALLPGASWS